MPQIFRRSYQIWIMFNLFSFIGLTSISLAIDSSTPQNQSLQQTRPVQKIQQGSIPSSENSTSPAWADEDSPLAPATNEKVETSSNSSEFLIPSEQVSEAVKPVEVQVQEADPSESPDSLVIPLKSDFLKGISSQTKISEPSSLPLSAISLKTMKDQNSQNSLDFFTPHLSLTSKPAEPLSNE